MDNESQVVDFKHMTVKRLEEIVGRPVAQIKERGEWIECCFAGQRPEAQMEGIVQASGDITISFRKW